MATMVRHLTPAAPAVPCLPPPAALLRDLGVPLSPSQLSQAIAQLDTQQVGRITFGEFLLWWKG